MMMALQSGEEEVEKLKKRMVCTRCENDTFNVGGETLMTLQNVFYHTK